MNIHLQINLMLNTNSPFSAWRTLLCDVVPREGEWVIIPATKKLVGFKTRVKAIEHLVRDTEVRVICVADSEIGDIAATELAVLMRDDGWSVFGNTDEFGEFLKSNSNKKPKRASRKRTKK